MDDIWIDSPEDADEMMPHMFGTNDPENATDGDW